MNILAIFNPVPFPLLLKIFFSLDGLSFFLIQAGRYKIEIIYKRCAFPGNLRS